MTQDIASHSGKTQGKRTDDIVIPSLPYEAARVARDCPHSDIYYMTNFKDQPLFCGLCLLKAGYQSELPGRLHFGRRTLAENGNPETANGFLSHLHLALGLIPPKKDETLTQFRRKRRRKPNALAREQYTAPAWMLYPVASALWKLMGYQPPLAIVLIRAVEGATEREIAQQLDVSVLNVNIRMVKAIRTAMGYLPRDSEERSSDSADGERTDGREPTQDWASKRGAPPTESTG